MDAAAPATFMLVFRESTPERYREMAAEQRQRALEQWNAWCDRLAEAGILLSGNPLEDGGRLVAAAAPARALDGPFSEAKELIGGYFLIAAADLAAATAIAEQCPNLRYGATVEVRQVAGACHIARSLGWQTMRGPSAA